ncbi:unnamed protein product [Paramecium sonneborni]|uniref:Uncharacterized protein n=1 Tax=Paramecium sonneborni TaxID=65129 RepID=A0A8S1NIM9_9CILI|nr:unnamed protein product [Paramecium sonneborni]
MNEINNSSIRNTLYSIQEIPSNIYQTNSESVFFSDDGFYEAEKVIQNSTEYMKITNTSIQTLVLCNPLRNLEFLRINYKFLFTFDNQFVILIRSYQNKSFYFIQNLIDKYCKEFNFDSCQFVQLWNYNQNIYLILSHYLTKYLQLYQIDKHMNINLLSQSPQWDHLYKIIHLDSLTQYNPCFLLVNTYELRLFCKFRLKALKSIIVKEINHIKAYAQKILILKPRYDSLETHFYQLTCNKLIRKLHTNDYRNSLYNGKFLYLSNMNTIYVYNVENGKLVFQVNTLENIENLRIFGEYLAYKNGLLYKGWKKEQNQSKQICEKVQQ